MSGSDWEQRLRRSLADTHEREPRPLARLELPLNAEKLLTPQLLKSLRPAAVLAPVIQRGDGLSMLLTRRAEHLRSHQGQISFPGGGRDPGDTSAADNALREAHEEIGLNRACVEILGYLDDYPTITRYRVTPVVGLVRGQTEFRGDPAEVAEIFEVPMELVLDPRAYQRKMLTREGLTVPFFELNHEGYRIWGATAGMLWNLCEKVNA